MAWLTIVRSITFGKIPHSIFRVHLLKNFATGMVSLFAVIVMALSADLISITEPLYYKFSALSLATSLLTLLTVIPMYALALGQVRSLSA
jgi:hypothetical protein